jgi:beta-galactosidase
MHGADYSPEQWLATPEVFAEDRRLMKLAGFNVVSVGIFSWSALEPEEGSFCFDWLDRVMDGMAEEEISVILATPTGSRPAWMSQRYPEVLRVGADRRRNLHGFRHNHCPSSPVYRAKAALINGRLAKRYTKHPALLMWHLSNEYGGECHCTLCQKAFRDWLKRKFKEDLGALNDAWWTSFWGHTYTDWEQIESPAPHGERYLPGLTLDWKRFTTALTVEFMSVETAPLRELSPGVPLTTNMMGPYPGLDYTKFAPHLDVMSWDSYPCWHASGPAQGIFPYDSQGRDWKIAADTAFSHDLMRSLADGKPFMLMESTPTFSNWHAVRKLKRPGVHLVTSLLAIAHGSDTVQYFQWRKGRGGFEKLHGAVVDHGGSGETRVFKDVAEVGRVLKKLDAVSGTAVPARAAILYDWENRWAQEAAGMAPREGDAGYEETCKRHHYPFWAMGIPTDVIGMERDFSPYRLVVAPMLYMVREGVARRLEEFVRGGGTLVASYRTGMVDENDLCFLGGFPGPLRRLLGLEIAETDELYPRETNSLILEKGNPLGFQGEFEVRSVCEIVRPESAVVLGRYGSDFYGGTPALTMNVFGKGRAFYLACGCEDAFLSAFYRALTASIHLEKALPADLPEGVTAQVRSDGEMDYVFLLNFSAEQRTVRLGEEPLVDILNGEYCHGEILLEGYGSRVLKRPAVS